MRFTADLLVWTGPRRDWYWLAFVLWTAAWVLVGVGGLLTVQARAEAGMSLAGTEPDALSPGSTQRLATVALVVGGAAVLLTVVTALLRRVARGRLARRMAG